MACMAYAHCILVATIVWILLLAVVAVVKIVEFSMDAYFEHYTNWSWTMSIVFFTAILGFWVSAHRPATRQRDNEARRRASVLGVAAAAAPPKESPPDNGCCHVRCAASVVACCYFPVAATVWFVSVAVFILLLQDDDFITDLFTSIDPGLVIVANDVFHVIPVFAIIFFAFVHANLIWYSLNRTCVWIRRPFAAGSKWVGSALYFCYAVIAMPVVFVLAYVAVLRVVYNKDVTMVYSDVMSPELALLYGILVLVATSLVVNGVPMCVAAVYTPLYDDDARMHRYYEARAMGKTDAELFGDVDERRRVRLALRENLSDEATAALLSMAGVVVDVVEPPPLPTVTIAPTVPAVVVKRLPDTYSWKW